MNRKYYEAYDDRYRQVHNRNLCWHEAEASPIVIETIEKYRIGRECSILEIGCGEGRDAIPLLRDGFSVLSTDISSEAIRYCRLLDERYADSFQVLDVISGTLAENFHFIYGIAVIHMLVWDEDRSAFYRFIRDHLNDCGIALICSMGDGVVEHCSEISTAFALQERVHSQTGQKMAIAGTSCRMVSFDCFHKELKESGLYVLESGITDTVPGFSQMMYAVVRRL